MDTFNKGFVYFICIVSAMGGLLFGYDWVVIGGVLFNIVVTGIANVLFTFVAISSPVEGNGRGCLGDRRYGQGLGCLEEG